MKIPIKMLELKPWTAVDWNRLRTTKYGSDGWACWNLKENLEFYIWNFKFINIYFFEIKMKSLFKFFLKKNPVINIIFKIFKFAIPNQKWVRKCLIIHAALAQSPPIAHNSHVWHVVERRMRQFICKSIKTFFPLEISLGSRAYLQ